MDDDLENAGQPTIVDTWLEPLGDPACGEDLEWDNDFLEMTQAAAGKPGEPGTKTTEPWVVGVGCVTLVV